MTDRLPGQPGRGREVGDGRAGVSRLVGDARFRNIAILLILLIVLVSALVRVGQVSGDSESAQNRDSPPVEEPIVVEQVEAGRVPAESKPEAASLRGVFVHADSRITFVPSWDAGRWAGYATLSGVSTQWWYNVHERKVLVYSEGYADLREFDMVSPDELRDGDHVYLRQPPVHKKSDAPESAASSEPDGSE